MFIWLRRVFGTGEHWRWGALSQPTREVRRRNGWNAAILIIAGGTATRIDLCNPAQLAVGLSSPQLANTCLHAHVPPPPRQVLDRLSVPSQEWHRSLQFTYWLQWHLHRQLLQASCWGGGGGRWAVTALPRGGHQDAASLPTCFAASCHPGLRRPASMRRRGTWRSRATCP